MSVKIGSDGLVTAINDILNEYGDAAIEAIEASCKDVAKQVVKDLKQAGGFKNGQDFRSGWTSKSEHTRIGASTVVYNKTKPGLAHLLEFGHAKTNGGRTKAFNFIAPINDTVEKRFMNAFKKRMGG